MVYCKLKERIKDGAVYLYGGITDDLTGEIKFANDGKSFDVIKTPEKSEVYTRSLNRLFGKYKTDFEKGDFKEKLSYEC